MLVGSGVTRGTLGTDAAQLVDAMAFALAAGMSSRDRETG